MPSQSKVTIHMVASLDGFIASPDASVDWLQSTDSFDRGITFEEAAALFEPIDCYVVGSRTYEHALELGWPWGDTPVIVLTRRDLVSDRGQVEFYAGDLRELVNGRLKRQYRNIWMVGGAMVTREFIRLRLADEIIIAFMPVVLGGGTPFFDQVGDRQSLHLKEVLAFRDGMVELWYEIRKEEA